MPYTVHHTGQDDREGDGQAGQNKRSYAFYSSCPLTEETFEVWWRRNGLVLAEKRQVSSRLRTLEHADSIEPLPNATLQPRSCRVLSLKYVFSPFYSSRPKFMWRFIQECAYFWVVTTLHASVGGRCSVARLSQSISLKISD